MNKKIIGILIILTLLITTMFSANANIDKKEIENINIVYLDSNHSLDNKNLILNDNLLTNPSFEEEEDNNPIEWQPISGTGATLSYVKNDGYSDDKCVSISNLESEYEYSYDYEYDRWEYNDLIPVDFINNTYVMSSYYKYINEPVEHQYAGINIMFYNENQEYTNQFMTIFPYSEEWTYSRYSSDKYQDFVKERTKFIRFTLIQSCTWKDVIPNNEVITFFDDVYFGIGFENNPPSTPTINGPTSGKTGISYDYEIMSIDPDNDKLKYNVYFEDGDNYQTNFYVSGATIIQNWTWHEEGNYTIRIQAEDTFGAKSAWSTLEVTMPKIKTFNQLPRILVWLFERVPFIQSYFNFF